MNTQLILKDVSDEGRKAFDKLLSLQKKGVDLVAEMADIAGKMKLADIEEICKQNKNYDKMFTNLLSIANQTLHVELYGINHSGAKAVKTLPLKDQDRALKEGLPILRLNSEKKLQIVNVKLNQLTKDDVELAIEDGRLLTPKQQEHKIKKDKPKKDVKIISMNGRKLGVFDKKTGIWKAPSTFTANGCDKDTFLEVGKQNGWL